MQAYAPEMQLIHEERGISRSRPANRHTISYPRDTHIRLHYHSSLEIDVFMDVKGTMRVGDREFDLTDARAVILPPETVHGYEIRSSPGSILVVHLAIGLLPEFVDLRHLTQAMSKCAPESMVIGNDEAAPEGLIPQSTSVFGVLSDAFGLLDFVRSRDADRGAGVPSWVRTVIDLTERSYSEPLTIDDAANSVGMSRSMFTSRFRSASGTSYHRFLTQVRVERARQMLGAGVSPTEVAMRTGFSDASHFTRVFKRETGLTPGRWQGLVAADGPEVA